MNRFILKLNVSSEPIVVKFEKELKEPKVSEEPKKFALRILNKSLSGLNDFGTQWIELMSFIQAGSFLKVHTIYAEEGELNAFPLILTLVYDNVFLRRISIPKTSGSTTVTQTKIPNLRQMHVQKRYTAEELGKLFK